jgi:hypothetical protein
MDKTKLNENIHIKILKASELFLKKEYNKNISVIDALDLIKEIKEGNLNDVTEIYIYEEGFGNTEKKLKDTIVHLITSTIAYDYNDENIAYLQDVILIEDDKKSDIALDYFLKIGGYHKEFSDRVLNFVENNVNIFTKNKLNTTAFYLAKIYVENNRTTDLFNLVNKLHSEKYPSQKNEQVSKKEEIIGHKKPWWKLW